MVTYAMGKIRRGGYVFLTWKGDHSPRHVHVYRDGRLILKWNLETNEPMHGDVDAGIRWMILRLQREGLL